MDFKFELFPLHSPLLGESLLVSFPPLNNMLKFRGYSHFIWGLIHRWHKAVPSKTHFHHKQVKQTGQTSQMQQLSWTLSQQLNHHFQLTQPIHSSPPQQMRIFKFTSLFHMFLLATRHRVCGLYSQLSESNLPRTHTVVRLRFEGKEAETSYPQTVVHQ